MPTISGIIVGTGTEASGRRTLRDIVDELARPYDASDSTIRALAADSFRAAVRTINRKGLWPWELQEEDITVTTNIDKYTLSGAVKKPLAMHYLTGSGGIRNASLGYIPYDRFLEQYDLSTTGSALIYTIPNLFETGQVVLWPIPNATTYIRFDYYRVTPAPRSEDETVEIPDYATEVYMAFAWLELSKRLPAAQARLPIQIAMAEARIAFRELSAHIVAPGDRSRTTMGRGY